MEMNQNNLFSANVRVIVVLEVPADFVYSPENMDALRDITRAQVQSGVKAIWGIGGFNQYEVSYRAGSLWVEITITLAGIVIFLDGYKKVRETLPLLTQDLATLADWLEKSFRLGLNLVLSKQPTSSSQDAARSNSTHIDIGAIGRLETILGFGAEGTWSPNACLKVIEVEYLIETLRQNCNGHQARLICDWLELVYGRTKVRTIIPDLVSALIGHPIPQSGHLTVGRRRSRRGI